MMNTEEIDQSMLGFVQEIEPSVPKKQRRNNKKVTVNPMTGETVVNRKVKDKAKRKPKEPAAAKRQAKSKAFWDSILE